MPRDGCQEEIQEKVQQKEEEIDENPIVALANRLRSRRELDAAIDAAIDAATASEGGVADPGALSTESRLRAFGDDLQRGIKLLGSILGPRAVTFVRLEKPLRIRLRFRDERVALDVDAARELVVVSGLTLDGEYQFDTGAATPSLLNLSKLSTEEGYREPLTPSSLLKRLAQDAELPPPSSPDAGPLTF
ncbi:MAG: hypothetical protein JO359_06685 [Candidatus Eremiobacteraeota bacterium]|nr:hypothetical protein [Candidatus Eremiobacteraeota bacterium]